MGQFSVRWCLAVGVTIAIWSTLIGCRDTSGLSTAEFERQQQVVDRALVEELFDASIRLLSDTDQLSTSETLTQSMNHLGQWLAVQPKRDDWQLDPLVQRLPASLAESAVVEALPRRAFGAGDGWALQETIWLRDAAQHVAGKINDPLQQAQALWRWTARQVALAPESSAAETRLARQAWEIMVLGHGTAVERAWIFMLLARQRGLQVVFLALPASGEGAAPRPWLPALVHDDHLYLFDPRLGLPLTHGAEGANLTLADVLKDSKRLEPLPLASAPETTLRPEDALRLVALVEASPCVLAERFRAVELRLSGEQRMVLSLDSTELAARLRKHAAIVDVLPWTLPLQRFIDRREASREQLLQAAEDLRPFRDPPELQTLWYARVLHLRGKLTGESGATTHYLTTRTREDELNAWFAAKANEVGQLDAAKLAEARKKIPPEILARYRRAKAYATYWLGLVSLERGGDDAALNYLQDRLGSVESEFPLRENAALLVAEALEHQGKQAEAIAAYHAVAGPAKVDAQSRVVRLEETLKR